MYFNGFVHLQRFTCVCMKSVRTCASVCVYRNTHTHLYIYLCAYKRACVKDSGLGCHFVPLRTFFSMTSGQDMAVAFVAGTTPWAHESDEVLLTPSKEMPLTTDCSGHTEKGISAFLLY